MKLLKTAFTLGALAGVALMSSKLLAGESTGDKIRNKAGEAGKNLKKGMRKGERNLRDATGNSDPMEDAKDAARNVGDEIEHQGEKLQRKVQ